MPDLLIRSIPDETVRRLDELARRKEQSRQAYLAEMLEREVGGFDPDLVLGYFQVERGDLDAGATCPGCGQPMAEVWVGITGAMRLFGPLCRACADQQ